MMQSTFKAYPGNWIDLSSLEVAASCLKLLQPNSARADRLIANFEQEFAHYIGTEQAVTFTNCRSALYYSLLALGLKEGDEVIVPAFTFWVDAEVIILAGLQPVFVDVELESANINPAEIEAAITDKTKAILLTHLNGLAADMEAVMQIAQRHKLRVIEDCARTCGGQVGKRRVGSFDIGAFSFGYGKSFYALGGGMVTSDDIEFMGRLRHLKKGFRRVSTKELYNHVLKGCLLKYLNEPYLHKHSLFKCAYSYRVNANPKFTSWFKVQKPHLKGVPESFKVNMYDSQAWLGLRQLNKIDQGNQIRQQHFKLLNKQLSGIAEIRLPRDFKDRRHLCVHYTLWTEQKEALQKFLMERGIDAQFESAEDVTRIPRFKTSTTFANAAKLHEKMISLPTHPCFSKKDIIYIAKQVQNFFQSNNHR